MANLTVNDKVFRIEFRHISKLGRRAQLHRGSVKAVTTCVVIGHDFIAIDNALCSDEDNFSRRAGRLKSLVKLIDHCGPLRKMKTDFVNTYVRELDPDPVPAPARPPALVSADLRAKLKADGQADKLERRQMRKRIRQEQFAARA